MHSVGLSSYVQLWICGLVIKHRHLFQLIDEVRLIYVLLKLPSDWLTHWGSQLVQVQLPLESDPSSIDHYLFVLEVALCSSNQLPQKIISAPSDEETQNLNENRPELG